MRGGKIRQIIDHPPDKMDEQAVASKVSRFYADAFARKLQASPLSAKQKCETINMLIEALQQREKDGIIYLSDNKPAG